MFDSHVAARIVFYYWPKEVNHVIIVTLTTLTRVTMVSAVTELQKPTCITNSNYSEVVCSSVDV